MSSKITSMSAIRRPQENVIYEQNLFLFICQFLNIKDTLSFDTSLCLHGKKWTIFLSEAALEDLPPEKINECARFLTARTLGANVQVDLPRRSHPLTWNIMEYHFDRNLYKTFSGLDIFTRPLSYFDDEIKRLRLFSNCHWNFSNCHWKVQLLTTIMWIYQAKLYEACAQSFKLRSNEPLATFPMDNWMKQCFWRTYNYDHKQNWGAVNNNIPPLYPLLQGTHDFFAFENNGIDIFQSILEKVRHAKRYTSYVVGAYLNSHPLEAFKLFLQSTEPDSIFRHTLNDSIHYYFSFSCRYGCNQTQRYPLVGQNKKLKFFKADSFFLIEYHSLLATLPKTVYTFREELSGVFEQICFFPKDLLTQIVQDKFEQFQKDAKTFPSASCCAHCTKSNAFNTKPTLGIHQLPYILVFENERDRFGRLGISLNGKSFHPILQVPETMTFDWCPGAHYVLRAFVAPRHPFDSNTGFYYTYTRHPYMLNRWHVNYGSNDDSDRRYSELMCAGWHFLDIDFNALTDESIDTVKNIYLLYYELLNEDIDNYMNPNLPSRMYTHLGKTIVEE